MYYVVFGLLYLLSLLPLRILFVISDIFYGILYYLIGYRKKVVLSNLAIAFPQKTEAEKKAIAKRFYRNFTDHFMETVKLLSADKAYVNKHFTADYSVFDKLYESNSKCQVHLGHIFNWEWGNAGVAANTKQKMLGVYMPIENKIFERLFLRLRSVTGAVLLPATAIRKAILPWRHTAYILGLVSDQSPADPSNAYWVDFFGRPTPFLRAPENGARVANLPVVYCHFIKKKRGYYQGFFDLAEASPASLPKGELTRRYAKFLEQCISANPDSYLWSHRRWKWQWQESYGPTIQEAGAGGSE